MKCKRKPFRCACGQARKPYFASCHRHRFYRQADFDKAKARAKKLRDELGWPAWRELVSSDFLDPGNYAGQVVRWNFPASEWNE